MNDPQIDPVGAIRGLLEQASDAQCEHLSGTIQLYISGHPVCVTINHGRFEAQYDQHESPDTIITMGADTFDRLLSSAVNARQALQNGDATIRGDLLFLYRVMLAFDLHHLTFFQRS
ncbi:SCP2 sterol-binding domain-containing protein [Salinisphaera sp. P385]|uniref:SCP2 sterol-binding domain-containing protein n=1 Tax=Spectribacter acetivorans TaxID=3075603 RepID=A0ABU3B8F7_9GAMM|nr:SCP2 sterol-binding domain-containing protein [Salinisphaera sp. P385]MDT0618524.1 SCP2 sterol-binding domain-containing protein [Salinisphaera sp. P385]